MALKLMLMIVSAALPVLSVSPGAHQFMSDEGRDSVAVRRVLAAALGRRASDPDLAVRGMTQQFYRGVEIFIGEAPGEHTMSRALVAVLPDSSLLPLGCATSRNILQMLVTPTVEPESSAAYIALLAQIGGDVPPVARPIDHPSQLPRWVTDWAKQHAVRIDSTTTETLPSGERRLSLILWGDALYRVVAILGRDRRDDRIVQVRLLVGSPPG